MERVNFNNLQEDCPKGCNGLTYLHDDCETKSCCECDHKWNRVDDVVSQDIQGEHPQEKYKLIGEAVSDLIQETFGNFTECQQQILVSYLDLFAFAKEAIKLSQIQSNTVEQEEESAGFYCCGNHSPEGICCTEIPPETNKGEDVEEAAWESLESDLVADGLPVGHAASTIIHWKNKYSIVPKPQY